MLVGKDQDQGMLHPLGETGKVLGEGNCDQKVVKSHYPLARYVSPLSLCGDQTRARTVSFADWELFSFPNTLREIKWSITILVQTGLL